MSCGPRKQGARANGSEYINRNNKAAIFTHSYRSVIFNLKNTKFAVELPAYKGRLHSKNEANCASRFRDTSEQSFSFCSSFFFFSHKHKNYSNSGMHTSIKLKFGTRVGLSKANIRTKFGGCRTKNLVVIIIIVNYCARLCTECEYTK